MLRIFSTLVSLLNRCFTNTHLAAEGRSGVRETSMKHVELVKMRNVRELCATAAKQEEKDVKSVDETGSKIGRNRQ